MQAFISDLVGGFAVSADDGQVGLVQFASEGQGRVEIALTGDGAAVQGALLSMVQIVLLRLCQRKKEIRAGLLFDRRHTGEVHFIAELGLAAGFLFKREFGDLDDAVLFVAMIFQ